MNCPSCGSDKFWYNGFNNSIHEQCFKCKHCKKQFYPKMFDPMKNMRNKKPAILYALSLHFHHNFSSRQIAKILKKNNIIVSHTSVSAWIKKFSPVFIEKIYSLAHQKDNKRMITQLASKEPGNKGSSYQDTEDLTVIELYE